MQVYRSTLLLLVLLEWQVVWIGVGIVQDRPFICFFQLV